MSSTQVATDRPAEGLRALSVLHVAQPTVAGVPNVVHELVRDHVARGWSVTVACPAEGDLAHRITAAGARHAAWSAARSPGLRSIGEARALRRIVERTRPDVIHLHSSKAGLAGRLAIRGSRPTIFQPHAWSFFAYAGAMKRAAIIWERFATRWTDAVVCVSHGERDAAQRVGIRGRSYVVPNGVDLAEWTTTSRDDQHRARDRLGLGNGLLVACVGRLCPQKGQRVLLAAWPEVTRRLPGAVLVLVGDGPDERSLAALGTPGVMLAGWSDDVSSWIAAADVVAIPSRWEAGLSLVAMEAMSRGRSVVATDVAGMREGLRGEAGAIVPVGDARALGQALAARLSDPGRLEAEGRAGRRIVEAHFDRAHTTAQLVEVYRAVLAGEARATIQRDTVGG